MKVILADYSGFCFGVEKAIDIVFDEMNKNNGYHIYSLGPLIHNTQVVSQLEEKGLKVIDDIGSAEDGRVIIRSHGVSEAIYIEAKDKSLEIIDTTCPYVKRIQGIVNTYYKEGFSIVIVGNPKHPEVIGINGWCNNSAYIIETLEEAKGLPTFDKLCVVSQTTMSIPLFKTISEELISKGKEVKVHNTICSATKQRQEAARRLAKEVEAIIVVGGTHSSNTQKLVKICKEELPNSTFSVETVHDLDLELLKKYGIVGITAGASTPKWAIDEIIKTLEEL
ncbi:4-hydroxy-3-methylbut-2-enyl diphosphate reductase [Alkaliphilus serpentinus]|uniref:4-hydroxy-3-methylbut-2-enyl diphosphate reductase n=1 Tax=Alkaliphilus serpentinus TaxID=1482731 RepID=A0A833HL54_9FIRM|nr:4-hydroxy-3-methylbut-2-enyl diphosphate reductase [Alkaliphilus serpentinus]KAB3524948.1 4-hydroxy-3-methylbut-2-enyl diphosphate reductase [Alkaliphilus serpentinus]